MKNENKVNLLYHLPATLLISALLSGWALGQSGPSGTSGGDERALARYNSNMQHLSDSDRVEHFRLAFCQSSKAGLMDLQKILFMSSGTFVDNKNGRSVTMTPQDLQEAWDIAYKVCANKGKTFRLDPKLRNSETNEPRLAANTTNGEFIVNPVEWTQLDYRYGSETAEKMRRAFSVHEILSQPEIGLERTSQFAVSSSLLDTAKLSEIDSSIMTLSRIFPDSDLPNLYSCSAEIWDSPQTTLLWRTLMPHRTYLRWASYPGEISAINNKMVLMNPNFASGTSGACYSWNMKQLGYRVNTEHLLFREPSGTYIYICGPMSDSYHDKEGSIQVMVRRLDLSKPDGWHTFNYITNPFTPGTMLKGKGELSIPINSQYLLKMRCDRATKI